MAAMGYSYNNCTTTTGWSSSGGVNVYDNNFYASQSRPQPTLLDQISNLEMTVNTQALTIAQLSRQLDSLLSLLNKKEYNDPLAETRERVRNFRLVVNQ